MSRIVAPSLHPGAAPRGQAGPWLGARSFAPVGDTQTRILVLLLTVGATMLSWHLARLPAVNLTLSDAAYFGCLILLLLRGRLERLPFGNLTALWLIGLAMMQGGLLISTLLGGDPLRWLEIFVQYVAAYFLLPSIVMSVPRVVALRCLVAFVLGVAASQAIALIASLFVTYQDTWQVLGLDFITATGRIGAFSGNANTNGGMIAFALPMLVFATARGLLQRWHGVACGALLLFALVSTASFTAFSAAMIGMSVMALFFNPSRFLLIVLPVGLVLAAYLAFGLPLPEAFQHRVGSALTSGDLSSAGTFLGRMELLKEAWNLSGGTLLVGFGADQYRHVSSHLAPVHVFPMLILVEGGLIALLGLLIMLAILFGLALRALRIDRLGGAMVLAVLIEFLIFSLSVPHMYARLWIGPMFLVLASLYAGSGQGNWGAVPRGRRNGHVRP